MEKICDVKNVVIVDDSALNRAILKKMIMSRAGFYVCADYDNAEDCLIYVKNHPVDLVLMDLCLPYMNGVEASKVIKLLNPSIKIVLMSAINNDFEILASLFANVDAYAMKDISQIQLFKVINIVFSEEYWIDSRVQHLVFNYIRSLPEYDYEYFKKTLNSTECTLINLVLKGFAKKEVAQYLNIRLADLSEYVCAIFKKLSKTKKVEDIVRNFKYDFI